MANRFLSNITINDAYTFPSADGTNGQVIGTDGDGNLSFVDQTTEALTLNVTVKNVSGGSLAKGTIVHAHPSATPPSGNVVEVIAADYDTSASMPAIGVLNETLANEAEGQAIMFGAVSGIDTSSFSAGDELWVGNDGAFTNTKPATAGQLIQKIAVVIKSHASNGLIKIFGAGRTNDVPLPFYIDDANQRVGIGTDAPSQKLDVQGSVRVDDTLFLDRVGGFANIKGTGEGHIVIDPKDAAHSVYLSHYVAGNVLVANGGGNVGIGITAPSAKLHVKTSSNNNEDQVLIESDHAGSGTAPDLNLFRNSLSPANDDNIGAIWFDGNNNATPAERISYTGIYSTATNVTDGSEDGKLTITNFVNGTFTAALVVDGINTIATGSITADSIIKSGGTSGQFLKADGSVDSNTYLTDITGQTDPKYLRSDVNDIKTGYILFNSEGTADVDTNYPSYPLIFRTSGWDTNNASARTVDWYIRSESTSSVYPDGDLVFYEEAPSYSHYKLKLHGRGSGSDYQDSTAASFYGNVNINQTTDSTGGNFIVAGSATANSFIKSGGTSSQFLKADGSVDSNTYLTDITVQTDPKYLRSDVDDTTSGTLQIQGSAVVGAGGTVRLNEYDNGLNNAGEIELRALGGTGWEVGDSLGRVRFYTNDGSGIGVRDLAKIEAFSEVGNGTTTTTPNGSIAFFTSNANEAVAENLRLTGSGDLKVPNGSVSSDLFKSHTYSDLSFLNFNDDQTLGVNMTTLSSAAGMNLIWDSNDNDSSTFTIWDASGDVDDANKRFEIDGSGNAELLGNLTVTSSASSTTISGDAAGNIYYNNTDGEHRFRANGSTVNSVTISSSNFVVNEATTINADAQIDGHLSILDTNSLYMFDENGAKVNIDARGDGTGAMLHKWNRNSADDAYLAYYENWYDGSSYHQIGVEADTWRIGTRGGDGVLYVGDLDASTNGALDSNKQGIVIQGTGGQIDAAQDGTERLPVLQFFDSVGNYGSATATAGELRGGVEWYSSESSSNFPAISGAIYSVNENTYNTAMGLGFYTNNSQTTPSEVMRLTAGGDLDLLGRDFKIGGTTVIDSSRNASFETLVIDDVSWDSNKVSIQGVSPNIEFRDTSTGAYWYQIGVNSTNFYVLHDTDKDGAFETTYPLQLNSSNSTGILYGSRIFADNYHPNADKWTTARTITLGGDLTGSVSVDGSSNVTLSAQVVNDSHTHDGRYYTEGETDNITAQALGWVPAYSNANVNTVQWNDTEQAVRLYSGSDTQIGMAYKAIRMKAGDKVRLTVMVKSASAETSGLYLRLYFYNGNLPDGKTHVSHNAETSSDYVQEDSSGDTGWYENSAIGTDWTNFERTYTAPADGYVSLVILNWTGIGTGAIYVKQPDIQFEKVNQAGTADLASDAQTLDGVNSTSFLRSDADDEATGFIVFDNNSGIRVESGGSTPDSTTNTYQQGVTITGGNQRLNIDVSDVTNGGSYIQTRHSSSTYPTAEYALKLNPLGGDVEISNATILAKPDGRVGINKSPTYQLDVAGQTYLDGNVYVANTNTASNAFYVMRTTATNQSLRIHVTDDSAVFTSIQDENTGAFGSFVFNMDSGAADPVFDVRYGSSTVARFRANGDSFLGTSGNVGIGNTNPENKVHIEQSINDDLLLEIDNQNTGASSSAGLLLRGQGNNFFLRNWGDGTSLPNSTEFKSTAGGGNFRFNLGGNEIARMTGTGVPLQVNHNDSNPTLYIGRASGIASIKGGASGDGHVIIDSSNASHATWLQHYTSGNVYLATGGGNVGVGTTTTSEKLTISGGISLTGNIEFGSSNGDINLSRGSYITFYEDASSNHSISSRNGAFSESDDIRINSYGSVLINLDSNNNNTSSANLSVGRHGSSGTISDWLFVVDGETGAGTFKGDVIAFGSPSDISLKENIKPIEGALDKVKRLQGVTFDWKQNDDDILKIKEDYGFIAQEVQEVLPELVRENENGKLSLRDKGIISVLVEAVKEQQKQIDELKNILKNK